MRIVVTGGSGKAGRWVVRDLRDDGHDVLNVDLAHDGSPQGQCIRADLTDLGQAHDVIAGADAVVHLAAIPAPELRPAGETFRTNTLSTYNVFAAATERGVAASSGHRARPCSACRSPRRRRRRSRPWTKPTIRPESSYALSKLVGETMAAQFARRTGVPFVGLRISNIMEPGDYAAFPGYQDDPRLRMWNLWGYVDVRDVARRVRAALTADVHGAEVCIVAAADTVMHRPSATLMAEVFPGVPLRLRSGPGDAAVDRPRRAGARLAPRAQLARHTRHPGGTPLVTAIDFARFDALTFDCYGTLIDWETGILAALRAVLDAHGRPGRRRRAARGVRPRGGRRSRPDRTCATARSWPARCAGSRADLGVEPDRRGARGVRRLGRRLAARSTTARTRSRRLKERFRLGVITNCDDDLFAASNKRLGVDFDWVVTAQQVGSYKPSHRNFDSAFARIDVPRERILHVAQSLFHDHVPAQALGLTTAWIDRRHDKPGSGATPPAGAVTPNLTAPDMATFADLALGGAARPAGAIR